MTNTTDISTTQDVRRLVDTFYSKIRADESLAPVFATRIADDGWEPHLQKMTLFWSHLLLQMHGYQGNPLREHIGLPLTHELFTQWLSLWEQTVSGLYSGPIASAAIIKAQNIAGVLGSRLVGFESNPLPITRI